MYCDAAFPYPEGWNLDPPHNPVNTRKVSGTKPNTVTSHPVDETPKNCYKIPIPITGKFTFR